MNLLHGVIGELEFIAVKIEVLVVVGGHVVGRGLVGDLGRRRHNGGNKARRE